MFKFSRTQLAILILAALAAVSSGGIRLWFGFTAPPVTIVRAEAAGFSEVSPSSELPVPEEDSNEDRPCAALDLNTITYDQLISLPGIGPVIAERILAFRREHGPFDRVEQLLDVSGIGEVKLAALRPLITVALVSNAVEQGGGAGAENGTGAANGATNGTVTADGPGDSGRAGVAPCVTVAVAA